MSDLNAALGISQFERFSKISKKNSHLRNNMTTYSENKRN